MTLYEFLIGRLADAGLGVADVAFVEWDTRVEYTDMTSWVRVPMPNFGQVSQSVDVADVTPQARERIRIHLKGDRGVWQWVNEAGDFVRVDNRVRSVTLTAAMLTT